MELVDLEDHMAYACVCGCVAFNLLKSGGIECEWCGEKLSNVSWGEPKWTRLKGSELHAKSNNPDFIRGAKWAETVLKAKNKLKGIHDNTNN